LKFTIKLNLKL